MNLIEMINDAIISYKEDEIDLEQARDLILKGIEIRDTHNTACQKVKGQ